MGCCDLQFCCSGIVGGRLLLWHLGRVELAMAVANDLSAVCGDFLDSRQIAICGQRGVNV